MASSTTPSVAVTDPVFAGIVAKEKKELFRKAASIGDSAVPPLSSTSSLVVCVRKRPLSSDEVSRGEYDTVTCLPDEHTGNTMVVHNPKLRYDLVPEAHSHTATFDRVFGEGATNQDIYVSTLRPLMRHLDEQRQVTVFCFGQTGSGKTYTLEGLTNRCLHDVFSTLKRSRNTSAGRDLAVCISYYEIYCAKAFDLLADRAPLQLREDGNGSMQVSGLLEVSTRRKDVAAALIEKGKAARIVGCTKMNNASSRSHSVLQIMLREMPSSSHISAGSSNGGSSSVVPGRLVGKCSLVDLAGSEQASEADFELMKDKVNALEAAEINKSLLSLKECIRAIGRGQAKQAGAAKAAGGAGSAKPPADAVKKPTRSHSSGAVARSYVPSSAAGAGAAKKEASAPGHTHIPFRGSLLTKVLRDCFTTPGAVTVMINTVSPGSASVDHTLNTLRYASRLKDIGKTAAAAVAKASAATAGGGAATPEVMLGGKTTAPLTDNVAGVRRGILVNGGDETEIAKELLLPAVMTAEAAAAPPATAPAEAPKAASVPPAIPAALQPAPVKAKSIPAASAEVQGDAPPNAVTAALVARRSVRAGPTKKQLKAAAPPIPPPAPSIVVAQVSTAEQPLPVRIAAVAVPIATAPVAVPLPAAPAALAVPPAVAEASSTAALAAEVASSAALLALVDAQISHLMDMRRKLATGSASAPDNAATTVPSEASDVKSVKPAERKAVPEVPATTQAEQAPSSTQATSRAIPSEALEGLAAIGAPVVIEGQGKAKAKPKATTKKTAPLPLPKAEVPALALPLPPHEELPALASTRRALHEQLLGSTPGKEQGPLPEPTGRSEATLTATAASAATATAVATASARSAASAMSAGYVATSGRASPRPLPGELVSTVQSPPLLITSRTAAQMVEPSARPSTVVNTELADNGKSNTDISKRFPKLSVPEALGELEDLLASVSVAASAVTGRPTLPRPVSRSSSSSSSATAAQIKPKAAAPPSLPPSVAPPATSSTKVAAPKPVAKELPPALPKSEPAAPQSKPQPQKELFFQSPKVSHKDNGGSVPIFETDVRMQTASVKATVAEVPAGGVAAAEAAVSSGPAFHTRKETKGAPTTAPAVNAKPVTMTSSPTAKLLKAARALQHEALAAGAPKVVCSHPYALPADAKGAKQAAAVSAEVAGGKENALSSGATQQPAAADSNAISARPTSSSGSSGGMKISKSSRENIASAIASGALRSPKRGGNNNSSSVAAAAAGAGRDVIPSHVPKPESLVDILLLRR